MVSGQLDGLWTQEDDALASGGGPQTPRDHLWPPIYGLRTPRDGLRVQGVHQLTHTIIRMSIDHLVLSTDHLPMPTDHVQLSKRTFAGYHMSFSVPRKQL